MNVLHSVVNHIEVEVQVHRKSANPVNPLFLNRGSPRAYSDRNISDEDLYTILEAARWAPSSFNDQPWRFIVAKTENQLQKFHSFLADANKIWAVKAPVLVLIASDKKRENGDPSGTHAFDTGTA